MLEGTEGARAGWEAGASLGLHTGEQGVAAVVALVVTRLSGSHQYALVFDLI